MKPILPIFLIFGVFILVSTAILSKNQPLLEEGFAEIVPFVYGLGDEKGDELEPEKPKVRKITKKEYGFNYELTEFDDGTGNWNNKHRYADSNGTKIEEAKSLKTCEFCNNIILSIDLDKKYPVKVLDYNFTSITLDIQVDSTQLNKDIPLKVYNKSVEINETTEEIKDTINIEYSTTAKLNSVSNKQNFILPFGFGKVVEWGKNSTLIQITGGNISNDAYVDDGNVNTNYDDSRLHAYSWTTTTERDSYSMIGITDIPADQQIDEAIFACYANLFFSSVTDTQVDIHHVYDHAWDAEDETSITWNNQVCGAAFDDSGDCNLTASDFSKVNLVSVYWDWDVTSAVQTEYNDGDGNVSFFLRVPDDDLADSYGVYFDDREDTGSSGNQCYLNITYSEAADTTEPSFSSNSTNASSTTYNGTDVQINLTITDSGGIDFYRLSINDTTDSTWKNLTLQDASDSTSIIAIFNYSIVNISGNGKLAWQVWANDTADNKNVSTTQTFDVQATVVDTCECSSIQAGTTIDCSENCDIEACDANGKDIFFLGTGTITISEDITNHGTVDIYGTDANNKCIVKCLGGCFQTT